MNPGLRLLTICAAAMLPLALAAQGTDAALLGRARAIHDRLLTIDTHIDFDVAHFTAECNYTQRLITQANLPKMREGGLDVPFLVVHVAQGPLTPVGYSDAYRLAVAKFDAVHRLTEQIAPTEIALARTSGDVTRLARRKRNVSAVTSAAAASPLSPTSIPVMSRNWLRPGGCSSPNPPDAMAAGRAPTSLQQHGHAVHGCERVGHVPRQDPSREVVDDGVQVGARP